MEDAAARRVRAMRNLEHGGEVEMGGCGARRAATDGITGCPRLPCDPDRVGGDVGGWVWSLWPLKADTMPVVMVGCIIVKK